MKNKQIIKELIDKLFETGELYDELFDLIEQKEIESLKPYDNNIYSIYYDPQDKDFYVCEFTDYGNYPCNSDEVIHIIDIENQYNDEFWGGFKDSKKYPVEEYIKDTLIESDCVYFLMEEVKANLEEKLSI